MKKIYLGISLLLMVIVLSSCSGKFWAGTGSGIAGTGAGYEINAKREEDRIQKDLNAGRITQQEFDIRRDQIKRMSVIV